jgi:hypothetical protein
MSSIPYLFPINTIRQLPNCIIAECRRKVKGFCHEEVVAILETASSLVAGAQHTSNEDLRQRLDEVSVEMFQLAGKGMQAIIANEGEVR